MLLSDIAKKNLTHLENSATHLPQTPLWSKTLRRWEVKFHFVLFSSIIQWAEREFIYLIEETAGNSITPLHYF